MEARLKIFILGATSTIARRMAAIYADRGHSLVLGGRDMRELERIACDLRVRYGASAEPWGMEPRPDCDMLIVAAGYLGSEDPSEREKIERGNYLDLVPVIDSFYGKRIVVLSSVAADRLRKANRTYGAAKGRLNLHVRGWPRVTILKLGPVDTEMTFGVARVKGAADPEKVARACVQAIDEQKSVAYVPAKWRPIMAVVKRLPQEIVDKL